MEQTKNFGEENTVRKRVARRLPPGVKPAKKMELFTGRAPEVFEWGWTKMPMVSRVLISGTFLTALALGLPYWANIHWDGHKAHFGLFAYCLGELGARCTSIHDNLIPDRDVPLWYHFTQVSFFIGTTCGALAMFVVYSNHQGRYLMIPPTTRSMAVLMLMVAVIQLSISIYTFLTYFDHTDFLYEGHREVSFHGAFYCAVLGDFCYVLGALMLLLDTEKPPLDFKKKLALKRRQESQARQKQQQIHGQKLEDFPVSTANKDSELTDVAEKVIWPETPVEIPEKRGFPIGQTLVKVVDPDSVYHYTAQDYIVKHTADQDLDLPALARATGGVNISPTKVLSKCASQSQKSEESPNMAKTDKRTEERKREQERRIEEQKKKEDDLPPWVRYHNLHSGDPHRHCQCIHNQTWRPVSARVVASQPQVGSGPKITEIL